MGRGGAWLLQFRSFPLRFGVRFPSAEACMHLRVLRDAGLNEVPVRFLLYVRAVPPFVMFALKIFTEINREASGQDGMEA